MTGQDDGEATEPGQQGNKLDNSSDGALPAQHPGPRSGALPTSSVNVEAPPRARGAKAELIYSPSA